MTAIKVEGGEQFAALARRLKEYGDGKTLRKEFYRGINRTTRPLIANVRASARDRLPSRGGLAKRVAASKITTSRRMTGASAGVRIRGTSGYDIRSIDRGRVRHPTFGHEPWVSQIVREGFWTDPLNAGAPAVRRGLEDVMDDVAKKITG